ncbi:MAG TPA: ABC transporter permease [Tepidisphaeraceae bacterium]|nr:ABC transporter permease [Tepidisphaeraceae bacterium]
MASQGLELAAPPAPTVSAGADIQQAGEMAAPRPAVRDVAAARPQRRGRLSLLALLPAVAAAVALALHTWLPNGQKGANPTRLYPALLSGMIAFGVFVFLTQRLWRPIQPTRRTFLYAVPSNVLHWCVVNAPLPAAGVLLLCAWDLVTLKFALMPLPYFPGPDAVIQTLVDDWASAGQGQPGLFECMTHSLALLFCGYLLGAFLGVTCGVLIGWFRLARYWGMPVMKLVGPIPATALIPMSLMLFHSPMMSAVALVALAVWFPVTMLTLSGVMNVRGSYLDVARTLGARPAYLIFRVAIPAAAPSIFVGLFMGLGASFLTLVVAEGVGVQAGLGWYIDWARAYSDYSKVYAALVIMTAYFSTIMTLLFKVRDRVLVWQKGVIKW